MQFLDLLYQQFLLHPIICTDTRTVQSGCIFFALKGDRFNGNSFASQAIASGAALAVIDEPSYCDGEKYLLVEDVLMTLQALAKFHRSKLNIPLIGLTGSNGKTTTKELVNAVLSEKFKTFATKGNLNNHIGVPLSVLSITSDIEIAVIEMGANHQGEIALLCEIARPTHGLVSNVGMAHLEGFGGFEGVKKGKAELYAWLVRSYGTVFINESNPLLMEMAAGAQVTQKVAYGASSTALVQGKLAHAEPLLELQWWTGKEVNHVALKITGAYNFENALAAICIGHYFGMDAGAINRGLSNYTPANNRSQLVSTEQNTVICDFYNANPSSMLAALTNISVQQTPQKAAILGDMFELGPESSTQHAAVIEHALKMQLDHLLFIGEHFYVHRSDKAKFFKDTAAAMEYLAQIPFKNQLILLKGSRGMALERFMPLL